MLSILFHTTSKHYPDTGDTQSFSWHTEDISKLEYWNYLLSTDTSAHLPAGKREQSGNNPYGLFEVCTAPYRYPVKMQCVACSHVSLQGRGQILSGNILTDVILFQTQIPLLMYTNAMQKKQRGRQKPEEKNSAFCQQHPQARTHTKAVSNLISERQLSGIKMHVGLQEPGHTQWVHREMGLVGQEPTCPRRNPG